MKTPTKCVPTGTPSTPLLLKPAQAASTLAISPRKLWSLTACREIPCVRFGRVVRYSTTALQQYIDAQSEGGIR